MEKEKGYVSLRSIKIRPPSWEHLGLLLMSELKKGSTDFALGIVPVMLERLIELDKYADEDGKLHVSRGVHHVEGGK
jgi:hypothetical protein